MVAHVEVRAMPSAPKGKAEGSAETRAAEARARPEHPVESPLARGSLETRGKGKTGTGEKQKVFAEETAENQVWEEGGGGGETEITTMCGNPRTKC